jgi:thiol peroxidase
MNSFSGVRLGPISLKGTPLTLEGTLLQVGDTAPVFRASKAWNDVIESSQFEGKVRLFNVVPSLDTGICDAQTKRFGEEANKISGVEWVTVSTDQPPSQKRWCGASQIENLTMLSDAALREFGQAHGLWITELGALQRAVIVIGSDNKVKYVELVPEIAQHVDYDKALEAVKDALA